MSAHSGAHIHQRELISQFMCLPDLARKALAAELAQVADEAHGCDNRRVPPNSLMGALRGAPRRAPHIHQSRSRTSHGSARHGALVRGFGPKLRDAKCSDLAIHDVRNTAKKCRKSRRDQNLPVKHASWR